MSRRNGRATIRTALETLTPRKAEQLLANRAPNRPLSEKAAQVIADAILHDEWQINGETIKVNDHQQMEDGQHRCRGVMLANKPIETFITRGLPANNGIFDTIDTGRRRTVGHLLARRGEQHACALAAAVGLLWRYETGRIRTTDRSMRHAEAMATLKAHPGLRECTERLRMMRVPGLGMLMPPSLIITLSYLFRQKDAELEESFFARLGSGDNLTKRSPILALRNRLYENKAARASLPTPYLMAISIKAWNACRAGKSITYLRWRTEGGSPEPFPEIE